MAATVRIVKPAIAVVPAKIAAVQVMEVVVTTFEAKAADVLVVVKVTVTEAPADSTAMKVVEPAIAVIATCPTQFIEVTEPAHAAAEASHATAVATHAATI